MTAGRSVDGTGRFSAKGASPANSAQLYRDRGSQRPHGAFSWPQISLAGLGGTPHMGGCDGVLSGVMTAGCGASLGCSGRSSFPVSSVGRPIGSGRSRRRRFCHAEHGHAPSWAGGLFATRRDFDMMLPPVATSASYSRLAGGDGSDQCGAGPQVRTMQSSVRSAVGRQHRPAYSSRASYLASCSTRERPSAALSSPKI